ncbi:MAG: hypothetical protein ACRD9R_09300, partial [Pyrinomonadaceae bacterium]
VRQKPVGRQRLARDLQQKKLSREVAEQAIEQVYQETPEEKLIDEAIAKRIRLRGRPRDRQAAKSLFDHLLRRGFSYELVINKVRPLSSAAAAAEETDDDAIAAEAEPA